MISGRPVQSVRGGVASVHVTVAIRTDEDVNVVRAVRRVNGSGRDVLNSSVKNVNDS